MQYLVQSHQSSKAIDAESIHLDMMKKEHKAPEYMAMNPAGTLPFMMVDDKLMTESASMLRYLCRKFEPLKKYYPNDIEVQQQIDCMLDYNATVFRPTMLKNVYPRYMRVVNGADDISAEGKAQIRQAITVEYPKVMDFLNSKLEGNKFLCGD
jgi:glutathione S-transferase